MTAEERRAFWDDLYDQPGFALLAANFVEIYLDEALAKGVLKDGEKDESKKSRKKK